MKRGTTLAVEDDVPDSSVRPSEAVWRSQRDRFFLAEAPKTSKWSLGLGVLVQGVLVGILAQAGYPTWRICGILTAYLVFCGVHALVVRRTRKTREVESAFIAMNVSAQLFVVSSAALTGGVGSPFLPNTIIPAIISLLFFGPQATSRWIAVGNLLLVVAMAFLPTEVVGPTLPAGSYTAAVLLAISWNVFMLHMLVGKLSIISTRTGAEFACLREERLSEAEERLHRLQSVGAKVAHELKNPLASIKGLCQLVSRSPESERTQERLAVVASEISRMETILGEYLSFSRPLEDLVAEAVDVVALAQDVADVLAGRADQAGVTVAVEGSGVGVQGDPRRLKEALINLVMNAIEATPHGGSVRLKVRRDASAVVIDVVDSGRGISREDLERLGTSFFTTRPGGTGLGVVLASGVITQHGGTLDYASELGRGTTATIRLPMEAKAVPEAPARAALVEARA